MSQRFAATPAALIHTLWRHRGLMFALVQREVIGRYRGSVLGIFWSMFQPLLMLSVYTFVFSFVFKTRWRPGAAAESQGEFALVLFAGLMVFNLFAECINRAPGLVLANVNFVKKVVFPLEILPCVALGSALFHSAMSFVVWLVAYTIFLGVPHATIVFFPVIVFALMLFILGVTWALASLGVYLRDTGQMIAMVTTVLMFLSPIFYPVDALPARYRALLMLNPLTPAIEQARDVLLWGRVPHVLPLLANLVLSAVVACLGFAWFQKTRHGFADVL
jgi:lipopolysaccharide transport system permease protein